MPQSNALANEDSIVSIAAISGSYAVMDFSSFSLTNAEPLIALAVHTGNRLRPAVASRMILDPRTRLREEDSHTDYFAKRFSNHVIVNRSRFEVDLNRPRNEAIYHGPEDAWGLEIYAEPLPAEIVDTSLRQYDEFYEGLRPVLDLMVQQHGGFVLYDIHSYNHRRRGPDSQPEPERQNPIVNLGTGSLPRKWRGVADTFIDEMGHASLKGANLDVRENVKFEGRQVAAWTHENYGDVGCALAIEFKKIFMDEWTDNVDWETQSYLADALVESVEPVLKVWKESCL